MFFVAKRIHSAKREKLARLLKNIESPYQQHEEDKENISQEKYRAKDAVRSFQLVEVEVAQDDAELRESVIQKPI